MALVLDEECVELAAISVYQPWVRPFELKALHLQQAASVGGSLPRRQHCRIELTFPDVDRDQVES